MGEEREEGEALHNTATAASTNSAQASEEVESDNSNGRMHSLFTTQHPEAFIKHRC